VPARAGAGARGRARRGARMIAFALLIAATAILGVVAMTVAYRRSHDSLHPLLIACPIALFVYAYMPFALLRDTTLTWYVGAQALVRAQAVFLVLFAA